MRKRLEGGAAIMVDSCRQESEREDIRRVSYQAYIMKKRKSIAVVKYPPCCQSVCHKKAQLPAF